MTAAVLSIGTEITRGEIVNTNATWLSEALARVGVDVPEICAVPDDRALIRDALVRLANAHELVVVTGGLGPTTDDMTSECVAAVLGVPLERDAASLDAIRARMQRFGRALTESNAKQADFPRGATVLPNPNGTAPGFAAKIGRARCFFMPGVPSEMKPMFTDHVEPVASALSTTGLHQIRLLTFGLAESAVNDKLAGIEATYGVTIGYRAHFPEIEVKVLARAASKADAEKTARRAAEEVRLRLGDVIFGEGDASFTGTIGDLLRSRSLTIGTAESCTGGLVAELVTEPAGASDYFRGSIVSYANDVKTRVLGVPEALLAETGAVSAEVARAMAEGARRVLGVDVAVSLTGVAGPGGGTEKKPVGLVHFAVATAAGTSDGKILFPSTRQHVRRIAAYAALSLVRRVVIDGHGPTER
jgi:nicotinamide-nucleotide amidase